MRTRTAYRIGREILAFFGRLAERIDNSNLGLVSAGVAFYAMFAVFPALAAVIALWSLISDPSVISSYLEVAARFIPADAFTVLADQINALLKKPRATLGWTSFVSVFLALFSARAGVQALIRAINVAHGTRERTVLRGYLMGFGMTLALVAITLTAFAVIVLVPLMVNFLHLGLLGQWLTAVVPWLAMLALIMFGLAILYRFGPYKSAVRSGWLSPGAMVAALAWAIGSFGFSYYLQNFGAYNRVYGSIGAAIALLAWLYISAYAILLGAAINAELRHSPKPKGDQ